MKKPRKKNSYGGEYNRSIGSCYRLIEWEEEEISSHPFAGNSLGPTDAGSGTVAHRAVVFDLSDAGTRAVAHGAVVVKFTDAGTRAVADGAVTVDLSDAGT